MEKKAWNNGPFGDIEGALRELFESRGYVRYRMSKFEEYDLYAKNRSFITGEAILTFTDTDGRLMALKPDVTLSVIRNTVPGTSLKKVYYSESVYRAKDASSGFSEIPQAGLECIGELNLYSVCEVISMAAQALEEMSRVYVLDLSHMALLSGVLEDMDVPAGCREELLRLAEEKNAHELRALAQRNGLSPEDIRLLEKLIRLRAPLRDGVRQLSALPLGNNAAGALTELARLARVLGEREEIFLDLSLRADPRYYNGVVMRGYLPGVPTAVLSGGRYDGLMRRLHRESGAMGFAVYLNLLQRLPSGGTRPDADVLVIDAGADPLELADYTRELRGSGLRVRVDRAVPEGFTFGRLVTFDREGGHES